MTKTLSGDGSETLSEGLTRDYESCCNLVWIFHLHLTVKQDGASNEIKELGTYGHRVH